MENPRGTGLMAILAVSGSVVFVSMQIHKRVLSSFMKKLRYEIKNSTGALKEVVEKKGRFADEMAEVLAEQSQAVVEKKVRFADEMAEVVAEQSQAVPSPRRHDQHFETMPLNWQDLYKGILKHRNPQG